MTGPLDGVRIISLAHQYPGPYATMILGDLGAEVVVVEIPKVGDPVRNFPYFYSSLNRGKRSVAIDLKDEAGMRAFLALLGTADVLLEGFRPGTMDRLGLGPAKLRQIKQDLVYVSISGFGQDGPYRDRPGHDLTYQAEAGMLYGHVGERKLPDPPSLALGDLAAGLFAVQAVLVGLIGRHNDGDGSYHDVSMFDGLVSLLGAHIGPVVNGGAEPGFPYEPGYGVFETLDGSYLALGVAHEDHFWRRLCDALGLGEERSLVSAQRYSEKERLVGRLSEAIAGKSAAELEKILLDADVPFGRLRTLEELSGHPQIRARGLFVELGQGAGKQTYVTQPLKIDGGRPGPSSEAPALGADTVKILFEAGVALSEIEDLINRGVIDASGAGVPDVGDQGAGGSK